jgi:hypothetical protein
MWLAPMTSDKTYRFYMAPAAWVNDPINAPFVALFFWTALFGAAYHLVSGARRRPLAAL